MGPDNIAAIVLKTCASELAVYLAKLFQYSYNTASTQQCGKLPRKKRHCCAFLTEASTRDIQNRLLVIAIPKNLMLGCGCW
eukprot:g45056.t1